MWKWWICWRRRTPAFEPTVRRIVVRGRIDGSKKVHEEIAGLDKTGRKQGDVRVVVLRDHGR